VIAKKTETGGYPMNQKKIAEVRTHNRLLLAATATTDELLLLNPPRQMPWHKTINGRMFK